jgi:hypothetical protein
MLPKRIASWFQLFSLQPAEDPRVFVTCLPEVVDEALDLIRAGCEKNGKEFSASSYPLGCVPWMGRLGQKQFQTLTEGHGMPELISGCRRELEDFIKEAAGDRERTGLQGGSGSLTGLLDSLCGKFAAAESEKANLVLDVIENLSFADAAGFLGVPDGFAAGGRPPIFLSIRKGE